MFWTIAAQTALSVYSGNQGAKAQNELYGQNADNAIIANTYENQGTNEELREDMEMASIEKRELQKQALEAQSSAEAKGRDIGGASVERDEQRINNMLGEQIGQINANIDGAIRQTEAAKRGSGNKAQGRINSVPRASYNPMADIAKGGLAIAGDYAGAKDSAAKAGNDNFGFKDYAASWLGD